MCASAPDHHARRGLSSATRSWLLSPILKRNSRHFEALARARVPAAFHAANQVKLFGIDMLAGRIDNRLIIDMHHRDLAEYQTKAAERNLLQEGALHRDRRFCYTGARIEGASDRPASFGSSTPLGNAIDVTRSPATPSRLPPQLIRRKTIEEP